MRSLLLAFILLAGGTHFASAACDEPERHAPRNRALKRNHGDPPGLPVSIQSVTHLLAQGQKIENIFPGSSRSNIQIVPDSFQIPVKIVQEEPSRPAPAQTMATAAAAETVPITIGVAADNKLCPTDATQRYDNETGKCFYPGAAENPCNQLMDFVADSDNQVYGHCECKLSDGCDYRPIGYWPPTQQCYHLHEQGPCADNEWLIRGNDGAERCTSRKCPANPSDPNERMKTWIMVNETCYQLGTQAYCGNQNEGLYFSLDQAGKVALVCSMRPIIRPCIKSLVASATIDCDPGQKKYSNGRCSSLVGI